MVADYARAFGMDGARSGPATRPTSGPGPTGWRSPGPERSFFERSDVLSLHLRLVDATRAVVTRADLDRHEAVGAPREHQPGGADRGRCPRRCRSPPGGPAWPPWTSSRPSRSPISTTRCSAMDNVVCTPHIGYVSTDEWELQFSDVFDQVTAFAAGRPTNVVNPEVLDRANKR